MKKDLYKIRVDFEYLNEVYTVNSDPYNTLSELKDIVTKKIFPSPGNVHCFYKNIDLSDKEDDEISKIFPNKTKIQIILKRLPNNKSVKKLNLSRNKQPKQVTFEAIPNSYENGGNLSDLKSNTHRKNKGVMSLPSIDKAKFKSRQSCDIYNIKKVDRSLDDNIKGSNHINYLNQKVIDEYEKLKKFDKEESEIKNLMDKYKVTQNNNLNTDTKQYNDITFLISNLKTKNLNRYKLLNLLSFDYSKNKNLNIKDNPYVNSERNIENIKLGKINISLDSKQAKTNNIYNNLTGNKKNFDENYLCNSCKNNIISEYCLNCNEFKCKSCIELCRDNLHEKIKIKLNEDCYKNIISFGELIISKININLKEILKFDKELQIYDIKKCRDDLISFFNDILNIYNEIISILENIYKEKSIKKEMNKYELESNKIKSEINEILQKANSYLKNDENISEPKYKMMNIKYFYNLLYEKGKSYNLFTQNMKVYELNSTINSNIKKRFNEIENIMASMLNIENPFSLKNDLNIVYHKLIEKYNQSQKDRKKLFMKRRTIQVKGAHIPSFPPNGAEKNQEIINSKLLDI